MGRKFETCIAHEIGPYKSLTYKVFLFFGTFLRNPEIAGADKMRTTICFGSDSGFRCFQNGYPHRCPRRASIVFVPAFHGRNTRRQSLTIMFGERNQQPSRCAASAALRYLFMFQERLSPWRCPVRSTGMPKKLQGLGLLASLGVTDSVKCAQLQTNHLGNWARS